ncbi:MAG: RNA methyltransferase [Nitrospirae bacterium]|nr:RNA methyltransferase [Nitrospirota bacterium]
MKDWKDNISFVLVEPKEPGNIGASARAMKNMGFQTLELVKPKRFMTDEAKWMACNSLDVLENAIVHLSLRDAIKNKSLIIGTTRRLGKRRGLILQLRDSIKKIISAAKKNKVALLFGREDKGLNNKEVEECGFLITIPSEPSMPSLNLAQSVLLVAYELSQKTYKAETPSLVLHEKLETLYTHIRSTLKMLEYIPRGNRDIEVRIMRNLKHLIGRSGLTDWELQMLHGICSQVEKRLK